MGFVRFLARVRELLFPMETLGTALRFVFLSKDKGIWLLQITRQCQSKLSQHRSIFY